MHNNYNEQYIKWITITKHNDKMTMHNAQW